MEIVKKNVLSIICGGIILLSLIALFWPIGGMYESGQALADERKALNDKLQGLKTKQRSLPTLSLVASAEPERLAQFPGQKVIDAGTTATAAVTEQAKRMALSAIAMNQHGLLVKDSLPAPQAKQRFAFRDAYRQMMREYLPNEVLHSTLPPTEKDIADAEDKLWNEKYAGMLVYKIEETPDPKNPSQVIQTKVPLNQAVVEQKYAAEASGLPEKIRAQRAAQFQMYVDDGAIAASDVVIGEGSTPSDAQMWYAQNALWVVQDVCQSIARLNATAKNTLDSPVKHLISLSVAPDESQYVMAAPAMAAVPGEAPPPADPNAPLPRAYDKSPTGRVCNHLFDVVQFSIEVNVDARSVPPLMQELSRKKLTVDANGRAQGSSCTFITVNRVDLSGINKPQALADGFVYGEAPVVRVKLECEALLLRAWTTPLMPKDVKMRLGVEAAPPAEGSGNPVAVAH